jgi:hypothetical protein
MATKKTKKQKEEFVEVKNEKTSQQLETFGEVIFSREVFEHCEWCYQFDEDEPQVFAWTDETINSDEEPKVTFTIGNHKEAYITFASPNGKTFKLFPRELSEAGKEMRDKSKLKL